MSDHSARPRIESVGTFVLTVENPDPPLEECLTFDDYVRAPSITEVGSDGGTGYGAKTLTLSDDALVTTEDDSYVLAVVLLVRGEFAVETPTVLGHTDGDMDTVSDDSAEPVPDYLKLDGFNCFNGQWRNKSLFDGAVSTAEMDACDADRGEDYVGGGRTEWVAHVAYRACTNPMPAGTTITFNVPGYSDDPGRILWTAKALLLKNMAPYTSIRHLMNGDAEITNFDEGGIAFIASEGSNAVPDHGTCGIFVGTRAEGTARSAGDEDLVIHDDNSSVYVQDWGDGDGGPSGMDCDCTTDTYMGRYRVTAAILPPGGGTWTADTGSLLIGFDWDFISGWALPGQGFY